MNTDTSYQRHLPHQIPKGFPIFLTWNLKSAMPEQVLQQLRRERERFEKQPPRPGETAAGKRIRESKMVFAFADRFLDRATEGPMHLKRPEAAKIVEDSILFGVNERYELLAWCVMANHVHVLLIPRWEPKKITQGIKGYTAHEINRLQGAQGRIFWQDESYDHWARDEAEALRIIEYVENNPVAANLCKRPEDWPWSSARFRKNWPAGQPYRKRDQGDI
jgi:putative transposase